MNMAAVGGRIMVSPPGSIDGHVTSSKPEYKLSYSMSKLGLLVFC